ncbi:PEP-CTERM sorting domain-containing protein [Chitinispirillales bacterium ANBcel5]|uniref:PEP-CTERM sorting domain-containing protein n=1 Tax=Cellulosispirillum alkaliphilum TaxID=3039283 RepID=UPI002A579215|nr:PEP-CTERM sorting domain-containing protein [Chitinispirillales bacterium ANBcel5]
MIRKTVYLIIALLLLVGNVHSELIIVDDLVVYDSEADRYWYRYGTYYQGLPDFSIRDYYSLSEAVEAMNHDPALSNHRWDEWYVAGKEEINSLLQNEPGDFFITFQHDVWDLGYVYDRFFDKRNPADPNQYAALSVFIQDTLMWEDIFPEIPVPAPEVEIRYVDHDDWTLGVMANRGIWATADSRAAVPEPSLLLLMAGSVAGLAWAAFKERKKDKALC